MLSSSAHKAHGGLTRALGVAYIYALHKTRASWSHWKPLWGVPPCLIQHLCMLTILSMHVPALWASRVNQRRCVTELESLVLYYCVLQGLVAVLYPHAADEVAHTQVAWCLAWYVWDRIHRDWLPAPGLMQYTLVLYFVACVPLLWLQVSPTPHDNAAGGCFPSLSACMCDLSWIGFECVQPLYARLCQLMLVGGTSP